MTSLGFSDSRPPDPYPRSERAWWIVRRVSKWMWRALLVLVALIAIVWMVAYVVGSRRLDAALNLIQSDPTLSYSVPENWDQPAPGENAAPYFSAAFSLMAYAYPKMAKTIDEVVQGGWDAISEDKRADLRTWLSGHQLAFDLAAKGADRPWCRYSRQWWADKHHSMVMEPWRIPIPELEGVEQLGDALVVLAHGRTAEGKHGEARDAIRVALAVTESLRDDPFLASQGYRARQISSILENVPEIVPEALTEADVEEWLKIIPNPDRFDGCLERAAKWELKKRIDLFCASPGRYWFWQRLSYRWGPPTFSKTLRKRLADPLFKVDAAKCLEETAHLVEIWRKPYLEAKPEASRLEASWNAIRNETLRPTAPLLWHVAPAFRLEQVQTARARCVIVRTGLEWEKARLKTGSYPGKCDVIDPLTGHPLLMEEGPSRLTSPSAMGRNRKIAPISWVLRGK